LCFARPEPVAHRLVKGNFAPAKHRRRVDGANAHYVIGAPDEMIAAANASTIPNNNDMIKQLLWLRLWKWSILLSKL
jgi:hypothetical protein